MALILNGDDGITFPDSSIQAAAGLTSGYTAKAWVNVDVSASASIRGSGGVSSMTDNGTADITLSWATAFSSASYSSTGLVSFAISDYVDGQATSVHVTYKTVGSYVSTSARFGMGQKSNTLRRDHPIVCINAMGN